MFSFFYEESEIIFCIFSACIEHYQISVLCTATSQNFLFPINCGLISPFTLVNTCSYLIIYQYSSEVSYCFPIALSIAFDGHLVTSASTKINVLDVRYELDHMVPIFLCLD